MSRVRIALPACLHALGANCKVLVMSGQVAIVFDDKRDLAEATQTQACPCSMQHLYYLFSILSVKSAYILYMHQSLYNSKRGLTIWLFHHQ